MKKCPHCGGEARRSHKHGFLQRAILKPLGIRPFRCRDCGTRFYRFSLDWKDSHYKDQNGRAAAFGQPKDSNGRFKELIAQMHVEEGELGLDKQDRHMTNELHRLHTRSEKEGLGGSGKH